MSTLIASPSAPPEEELVASLTTQAAPLCVPNSAGSPPKAEQVANTIVLALLFAVPALMCIHAARPYDPDIWWHLRTGEWILQHRAVPQVEPFSSLAGKPWQAYSWLFEVIVIKLFQKLGLVGIIAYTSAIVLGVTVALYSMIRRLQADFSIAVLLTFVTVYSIGHLYMPRPWMFTILFFILEMTILMQARRTGRVRGLFWLPLIFVLWANIHIEYIDGLLVLGLAFAESVTARWWTAAETKLRPVWMGGALLASILATLANPYGWRVYSVVFNYSSRLAATDSALNKISELQAMPFRDSADFLILMLALASAAALAWKRRFVLFESALLIFAAVVSFRSQRDIWVMAIASAIILAPGIVASHKPTVQTPKFAVAAAALLAAFALFAGFRVMRVNNTQLQTEVAKVLPVDAAQAIRTRGYAGPVFDDYNWGGYLIWALRIPVSMDGRASFYGDESINRSIATWSAEPDWASDPQLIKAGIVIGPIKAALTQMLRVDPRFQLVYEDKLAAVFVARK